MMHEERLDHLDFESFFIEIDLRIRVFSQGFSSFASFADELSHNIIRHAQYPNLTKNKNKMITISIIFGRKKVKEEERSPISYLFLQSADLFLY
jgi:hypothetical protein